MKKDSGLKQLQLSPLHEIQSTAVREDPLLLDWRPPLAVANLPSMEQLFTMEAAFWAPIRPMVVEGELIGP
jgi:hypothetical protein